MQTLEQITENGIFSVNPDRSCQREFVPFNEELTAEVFAEAINSGELSVRDVYLCFLSATYIKNSEYLLEKVLPPLIALSIGHENELINFLLEQHPEPQILAKSYAESSRNKDLEKKVVGYLVSSLKPNYDYFEVVQKHIEAFRIIQAKDLSYVRGFFESDQKRLREIAGDILATYDFEETKDLLWEYAKHSDWRIRWNVLRCIEQLDTHDSRKILRHFIDYDKCEHITIKAQLVANRSKSRNMGYYAEKRYDERAEANDFDPEESEKARLEIGT